MEGFRALCGLGREKPFECVGETGESRAALATLLERSEWSDHAVVRALSPDLGAVDVPTLNTLLQASEAHCIPGVITAALPGEFV